MLVTNDWDKTKMTEARFDYLYQIINDRHTKGLQTMVTTNEYDMVGLEHRLYQIINGRHTKGLQTMVTTNEYGHGRP